MKAEMGLVCIVDDDHAIRKSVTMLIETMGVPVLAYSSARQFLEDPHRKECGCLVLDVKMPGMDGLELQARLSHEGWLAPIIFLTGHGDVPMAVHALQAGAAEFLQKPFDDEVLLARIRAALQKSHALQAEAARRAGLAGRLRSLSPREEQVLEHIVAGRMNKVIADELSISLRTVEDHRAAIMKKTHCRSVAELVQLWTDTRRAVP